jgi:hypothetical protein
LVDAETLYLDLYDTVADRAEYAQSDSTSRAFLPEAVIATLTAASVSAFVTAFSQAFGAGLSSAVMRRIKALLQGPHADSRDQMKDTVESLKLLGQYLPLLKGSTAEQRTEEERWVARELEGRGFPPHVAAVVASDMVRRLHQAAAES